MNENVGLVRFRSGLSVTQGPENVQYIAKWPYTSIINPTATLEENANVLVLTPEFSHSISC